MFGASGATLAALCQKLRIMALCREAYTLDNTVDDAVTQNTCHVGKSRTLTSTCAADTWENDASQPESFTQN